MMKKSGRNIVFGMAVMLLLSGCVPAPPQSAADEISRHHWIPQTAEGTLCFKDHTLQMDVRQGEQEVCLTGEYFVEDDMLTVLSEDYGTVVMTYTLVNNELRLTYFDKQAVFVKDESFTGENRSSEGNSCAK